MDPTLFTLRRTVIGGNTAPDDWSVLINGETVGRIHPLTGHPDAAEPWQWSVTLPLGSPLIGTAPTIDEAKRRWRAAWDRLVGRVGLSAIERAMAEQREAAERNR